MPAPEQSVFLYIIGPSKGPVKVGISHVPEKRVGQLQARSNERLTLMGKYPVGKARALAVERYAHWLLRDNAIGREWFNASRTKAAEAIRDAIETDVHPDYPMPPLDDYPPELRSGSYVRTKLAPGVLERVHRASNGRHADFIREAVERELKRRERQ